MLAVSVFLNFPLDSELARILQTYIWKWQDPEGEGQGWSPKLWKLFPALLILTGWMCCLIQEGSYIQIRAGRTEGTEGTDGDTSRDLYSIYFFSFRCINVCELWLHYK